MAKKFNPTAYVTQAARKAWMWSAVKKAATKDHCEECGATDKKLQVHHRNPVNVYGKIKELMAILIPPTADELDCLCKDCHLEKHRREHEHL